MKESSTEIKDEVDQEIKSEENSLHVNSVIMNIQRRAYVTNLEVTSTKKPYNSNSLKMSPEMKLSTLSAKTPRITTIRREIVSTPHCTPSVEKQR